MKSFSLLLLVLAASMPSTGAFELGTIKWFDGSGGFHLGDPTPYLINVLNGKVKDPTIQKAMETLSLQEGNIDSESIRKLADELDKMDMNAFVFLADSKKEIKSRSKGLARAFSKSADNPRAVLHLQGVGVTPQGPYHLIPGSDRNVVIIVPADPELMAELNTLWTGVRPDADAMFEETALSRKWKKYSHILQLDPTGKLFFDDLIPGSYLVWVNQYNILTYLYHINLKSGTETRLTLNSIFAYHKMKSAP